MEGALESQVDLKGGDHRLVEKRGLFGGKSDAKGVKNPRFHQEMIRNLGNKGTPQ